MKLIVLHITDLHVGQRITYFDEKITSISNIINNDSFSNNVLIVLSGDISYSGKSEQYELARSFINEIISKTQKTIKIAICPGNHDRDFANKYISKEAIDSINSDNYDDEFQKYAYLNEGYYNFLDSFRNETNYTKINEILNKYTISYDDGKVVVYSLNNSLLSSFEPGNSDNNRSIAIIPKDKLSVGRGNEDLSILLMHIPLQDMESKTKAYIKEKCGNNIDFIVSGHIHEEEFSISNNEVFEITSTALHIGDASGFSIIHIDDYEIGASLYCFNDNMKKYCIQGQEIKERLPFRKATEDGLFVDHDIFSNYESSIIIGGYEIDSKEIFVFPKLTERKYSSPRDKRSVNTFDEFLSYIDKKTIVSIFGDEDSGKTTLAFNLFQNYIDEGYSPVICNGDSFNSKKTKKTLKEQVDVQIRNNYKDKNSSDLYYGIDKSKRILIVDNSSGMTESMLTELSLLFDKIILLINSDSDDLFSIKNTANLPAAFLDIEFFYRAKREELYRNIYYAVSKRRQDVRDNFTVEQFIVSIEETIEKIEQKIVIDLESLIDFCGSALINFNIINGSDTNFIANRYQSLIDDYLKAKSIEGITYIILERIIGSIAFTLYKNKQTLFSKELVEQEIRNEENEYDSFGYSDPDKIIKLLIALKIIKSEQGDFLFASRNIFAHYIGFYAMHMYDNNEDQSCLNLILSNGVYLPLNFSILMDIAVSRNNAKIPAAFIDMLIKDIDDYRFENKDMKSIAMYFDEERQRVIDINENDIEQRRQEISKKEEQQRQEYLENSSNYFYEKMSSVETKQLIEMFNKGKILATLTNYGDMFKKEQKDKLTNLNLLYPNIIVDKYITYVKITFEDLYIKILDNVDEVKADKGFENMFNSFFDFLLSFVTATILTIYDSSARPVRNRAMVKRLVDLVKKEGSPVNAFMPEVQKLMLLSFSKDIRYFFTELKGYVDECKNNYYKQCALLIGRRVLMDNYEDVVKNYRPFLEYMKSHSGPRLIPTIMGVKNNH